MTQDEFNEMFLTAMATYGDQLENTTEIPQYSASDITAAEGEGKVLTMPGVVYTADSTSSTYTPTGYFQATMDAFRAPAEEAAEAAETTISEFVESATATIDTAVANAVADYIGTDYYVYRWNKESQTFYKTDIYVKGADLDYDSMTEEQKEELAQKVLDNIVAADEEDVRAIVTDYE